MYVEVQVGGANKNLLNMQGKMVGCSCRGRNSCSIGGSRGVCGISGGFGVSIVGREAAALGCGISGVGGGCSVQRLFPC